MDFVVIIPARFGASRLPGKPLRDLGGRPIIQHVHARALESGATQVVIATDDERVREAAESFGARVCMTSSRHESGTDRLAEVVLALGYADEQLIVNLQGDEPQMPAALIAQAAEALAQAPETAIATLSARIRDPRQLFDPNVVKVVSDREGRALYFSRAPIPWDRDGFARSAISGLEPSTLTDFVPHFRHIGIYAYRAGFLARFTALSPGTLETAERLEQLRALEHGFRIQVAVAALEPGLGIDTEEDLKRAQDLFAA
jgi:3-deoxy-manno-octulosonate cytidylyltransferase (CMP-KDO synthetase)